MPACHSPRPSCCREAQIKAHALEVLQRNAELRQRLWHAEQAAGAAQLRLERATAAAPGNNAGSGSNAPSSASSANGADDAGAARARLQVRRVLRAGTSTGWFHVLWAA